MNLTKLLFGFLLIITAGCEQKYALTSANFSIDLNGTTLFGGSRRFKFKRFRTKEEAVEDSKTQIEFMSDLKFMTNGYQLKPQEAENGVIILEGNLTVINVVRPYGWGESDRYEWRISPENNQHLRELTIEKTTCK